MATSKDTFANQATIQVTESAPSTLTFQKLETGISVGARLAWVLHRVEYYPNMAAFVASGDGLQLGLSQSNSFVAPSIDRPEILDLAYWLRQDMGAGTGFYIAHTPYVKDFSELPGGGLIFVPNPLYGYALGIALAAATISVIKLFYTQRDVSDAEFYELWQSRVQLSA